MSWLIDYFENQTGKSVTDDTDSFIAFCCDIAQKENMSVSSFRVHLYQSNRFLKKSGVQLPVDTIVKRAFPEWAKAGEARRARFIDMQTLNKIRLDAETESLDSLALAHQILLVGMFFGVRPIEIFGTNFTKSEEFGLPVIIVPNAKIKRKEENVIPERALMIVDEFFCANALEAYRNLAQRASGMQRSEWKRFYASAQQILSRRRYLTGRGELVHLYSGRHHFVSLARQHRVKKSEIQALLGHKLLNTQRFYGLKRFRLFQEKIFHVVSHPTKWVPEQTIDDMIEMEQRSQL